jgi:hypothetical protein
MITIQESDPAGYMAEQSKFAATTKTDPYFSPITISSTSIRSLVLFFSFQSYVALANSSKINPWEAVTVSKSAPRDASQACRGFQLLESASHTRPWRANQLCSPHQPVRSPSWAGDGWVLCIRC